MSDLNRAIVIAVTAHAGQVDKAGAPYILHPLRVMLKLTTDEERIVGVLHDVVEDCEGWSIERLRAEGFAPTVLSGLDAVTKRPDDEDDYEGFVRRAAKDPIGRRVKEADLLDNCDLSRIGVVTPRDEARLAKYEAALAILRSLAP